MEPTLPAASPTHQKKTTEESPEQISAPVTQRQLLDEIDEEIMVALRKNPVQSSWLIPIMVVMVVGATIYLSVIDKKIEYVYSLASACFGYYFGTLAPKYIEQPKRPLTAMNGVEQITSSDQQSDTK